MKEKKENRITPEMKAVEQYEGQAQQWAQVFDNHSNTMDRLGMDKHILRIGAMSVEIAPDGKSTMKEVIEGFKDLATHLHKLHQDEYLKMTFKSEGNKAKISYGRWICGGCLFGMKDAVESVVEQYDKQFEEDAQVQGLKFNPETGKYES